MMPLHARSHWVIRAALVLSHSLVCSLIRSHRSFCSCALLHSAALTCSLILPSWWERDSIDAGTTDFSKSQRSARQISADYLWFGDELKDIENSPRSTTKEKGDGDGKKHDSQATVLLIATRLPGRVIMVESQPRFFPLQQHPTLQAQQNFKPDSRGKGACAPPDPPLPCTSMVCNTHTQTQIHTHTQTHTHTNTHKHTHTHTHTCKRTCMHA